MNEKIQNPMSAIFKHLAISILFMFIGFMFGQMYVPVNFVFLANKLVLFVSIMLIVLSLFSKKGVIPRRFSMNFVYIFTFIEGVLLYPLLTYYLYDLGTGFFISILITTIIIFSTLAYISSKKEAGYYFGLGSFLYISLLGILIASIVNLFIGGTMLSTIISVIGVVVFCGYILFDVSLIKYEIENGMINDKKDLSIHVLNLYLDFINILLDLLRLASTLKD